MTEVNRLEFGKSLSADDEAIFPHLPYLLQDLWELGSIAEYPLALIKHLAKPAPRILDLGCGKGSTLIQWAQVCPGEGLGVDLEPAFIAEADRRVRELGLSDRLAFRVEDLTVTLEREGGFDLVIYGIDSDILGPVDQALKRLRRVIVPGGLVLLETALAREAGLSAGEMTRGDFLRAIAKAGFEVCGELVWDSERVAAMNEENTRLISRRANELMDRYPEKTDLFLDYIDNQMDECEALDRDFEIVSILLR